LVIAQDKFGASVVFTVIEPNQGLWYQHNVRSERQAGLSVVIGAGSIVHVMWQLRESGNATKSGVHANYRKQQRQQQQQQGQQQQQQQQQRVRMPFLPRTTRRTLLRRTLVKPKLR
ncbi:unnamed protein product, partial [Pylaiella littoralis]